MAASSAMGRFRRRIMGWAAHAGPQCSPRWLHAAPSARSAPKHALGRPVVRATAAQPRRRARFPRRRPPCPCCKFTSSTAISTELAINAWWISLYVPPRYPPRYCQTLRHRYQTVFEQRLSAGTRVTSHRGILHDFHLQATTSCTTHELSLF